jgi:Flp pilus assembly protein TadD
VPRATAAGRGAKSSLARYEETWELINRLIRSGGSWSGFEHNCFFVASGGGELVNCSAASGLDAIDDARGLAVWDFDRDGDLDFLVKNRSGPQLRLWRNDGPRRHSRIKMRLIGRESNRQAVGARVRIEAGGLQRLKEVTAGSGFLSQSSGELFFGLGGAQRIERLEVRWSSGRRQTFRGLAVNRAYLLREGDEAPESREFEAASPAGAPAAPAPGAATESSAPARPRVWLLDPAALPELALAGIEGRPLWLAAFRGKPLLINLWSPDCTVCLEELAAWGRRRSEGEGGGPELLAVTAAQDAPRARLRELAARFGTPVALASPADLLALSVLLEDLVHWPRELPLPASLLLDERGLLVRLYQGPVGWPEVEDDAGRIAELSSDPEARLRLALPFPGRYYATDLERSEFQLGVNYLEAGLPLQALQAFRRTLERRPAEVEALYNIGIIELEAGRLAEARRAFARAVETHPEFADALANLGVVAAREGRREEAAAHFERLLEKRPADVEALLNLGKLELASGRPQAALRRFEAARELEPERGDAHKRLGDAHRRLGDQEKARQAYEAASALEPRDAEAWSNLAVILAEGGDLEAARRSCLQAIEADPRYPSAHNNLGLILQGLGDHDPAEKAFLQAMALEPALPAPYLNLARAYLRAGKEKKARRVLEDLLAVAPGEPQAVELLRRLGGR